MNKQEKLNQQVKLKAVREMWQERIIKLNANVKRLITEYGEKISLLKETLFECKTELKTKSKLLKQYEKETAYGVDKTRLSSNFYGTETPLLTKEAEDKVLWRLKGKWRLYDIVSVNGIYWTMTNIAILKGDGDDFIQIFPDGNEIREQGKLDIHFDKIRK